MIVFLDIETTWQSDLFGVFTDNIKANKTLKDPEKINADLAKKTLEAKEKMCVDKDFNEIKMIGILIDGEYKKMSLIEWLEWDKENSPFYITYNGLDFDFPVIIRNIIKQGIECSPRSWGNLKSYLDKRGNSHEDLMKSLCGYGEWKSLDLLSQVYLGKKKEPIDFMTCTDKELASHNEEDLRLLEALYDKFKFIM